MKPQRRLIPQSPSAILEAILTCEECYICIEDPHEKNELQAALTILRRNYQAGHYAGTPYESIAKATEQFMKDEKLNMHCIFDHDLPEVREDLGEGSEYTEQDLIDEEL